MSASPVSALPAPAGARGAFRAAYLRLLGWFFTLFGTARVLAYLPTLLAIHASGHSNQHSLWTWGIWAGANLTMAAWLYENGGQRVNRAVLVSACNAAMCGATILLIAWQRWY